MFATDTTYEDGTITHFQIIPFPFYFDTFQGKKKREFVALDATVLLCSLVIVFCAGSTLFCAQISMLSSELIYKCIKIFVSILSVSVVFVLNLF